MQCCPAVPLYATVGLCRPKPAKRYAACPLAARPIAIHAMHRLPCAYSASWRSLTRSDITLLAAEMIAAMSSDERKRYDRKRH